jgi:hypothetical protein
MSAHALWRQEVESSFVHERFAFVWDLHLKVIVTVAVRLRELVSGQTT